jgi:hypothetical protein
MSKILFGLEDRFPEKKILNRAELNENSAMAKTIQY